MAARKRVASPKPKPSTPAGTVLVQVVDPFQVSDAGTVYGPGETLTVGVELAERWQVNGWVTLA